MSFDPNQSDVDRQVDASMKLFEQAKVGKLPAIKPIAIKSVLLCFDGSTQDQATIEAGRFIDKRSENVNIVVLDACEDRDHAPSIAFAEVAEQKWDVAQTSKSTAYDKIIEVVANTNPDLIVVPCPFGRDFDSVGADSAGTVIDVLLHRCSIPMLVIRRVDQPIDEASANGVMVVGSENEGEPLAARWAVTFSQLSGSDSRSLTLNLVLGDEQVENIQELLNVLVPDSDIDRTKLENALASAHSRLDAALRRAATEMKIRYEMIPRADATQPQQTSLPLLVILPLEADDRFGYGFAQSQIRQSPHPVLVVPAVSILKNSKLNPAAE